VLNRVGGFDWDVDNVGHIARHGVHPAEVEEAIARPYVIVPAQTVAREKRWKLFGTSAAGRYLVVVFTIRRRHFRAITAYTMNQRERKLYGPQIDQA